ncbi:MAG: hypothetical protein HY318_19880 [Armatimonadetes bacterium]|nr:hypothetical protein [Armatimonadota bacterium]
MLGDILLFVATGVSIGLTILLGARLRSAPRKARLLVLLAACAGFAVGTLDRLFGIETPLTNVVYWKVGGSGCLSLVTCLLFLSYAAVTRRTHPQRLMVWFLASIVTLVLVLVGGSSLFWRAWGMKALSRKPGPDGILKQSTAFTCAPAAAAMMLHCYGIEASEGEMAYYGRTNLLLGTSLYGVARGLRNRYRYTGFFPTYEHTSLRRASEVRLPFVAALSLPETGPHAVLVVEYHPSEVVVVDPYLGKHRRLSTREFANAFLGDIVSIQSTGSRDYFFPDRGPMCELLKTLLPVVNLLLRRNDDLRYEYYERVWRNGPDMSIESTT